MFLIVCLIVPCLIACLLLGGCVNVHLLQMILYPTPIQIRILTLQALNGELQIGPRDENPHYNPWRFNVGVSVNGRIQTWYSRG
jgi:hypothetical protein